ncbi:unnamed protein product [Adineta ricciae]|uniref:Peptidase M28 domain-containing protein n=1 Tax=Adineta ricciae TaxID=249248 RepID=A0A815RPF1_ADIRI|nr:unnamed protein product [Adineta ricciae]
MNQTIENISLIPVDATKYEDHEEVLSINKNSYRRIFHSKMHLKQFILWIVMFICLMIISGPLALYVSYAVPTVKLRSVSHDQFSEQRALDYLNNLTQFGSRVRNTRGNFQARDYLISELRRIDSRNKRHLWFQIELQNFTDAKENLLQNVLVRVSNASKMKKHMPSLMLSAHYDSVEFSPGGCDDGTGVVTILELLSNLVHDSTTTFSTMDLIVLFTNAEESGLVGAKAFANHHRWQSDIRFFINVDSMSCNEVAFLMEMTQSQLAIDYSRVARPRANVINELISMLPLWGTDFDALHSNHTRSGFDIGFPLDGYTYHTPFDQPIRIKQGIIQDLGNNLGILIRNLFQKENVSLSGNMIDTDPLIYFDVLSRYLIIYKQSTSILIQKILIILTITVSILLIVCDHMRHRKERTQLCNDRQCIYFYFKHPLCVRIVSIIMYFITNIISIITGFIISIVFSWIMSVIQSIGWHGNAALAMILFSLPYIMGFFLGGWLGDRCLRSLLRKVPRNFSEINVKHVTNIHFNFEQNLSILLIYCVLMIISVSFSYRALYFILIWTIFICPIYLCVMIIECIFHWKPTQSTLFKHKSYWLYLPLIVSFFPLIHTIGTSNYLIRLLSPTITKFFTYKFLFKVNLAMSGFALVPALFTTLNLASITQRIRRSSWILLILFTSFLLTCLITISRQPFDKDHPHVLYVNHTSTSIYRVANLTNVPMIVPLQSQSALITILAFYGRALSPVLDRFSTENNYELQNKTCRYPIYCTFNDSFNRTMSIKQIQIASVDKSLMAYNIIIQHVLSYNIHISSTSDAQLTIWNRFHLPRTETIIDVTLNSSQTRLVQLDINIRRCDISDSPFLVSLTQFTSDRVVKGGGNCSAINDHATLIIDGT